MRDRARAGSASDAPRRRQYGGVTSERAGLVVLAAGTAIYVAAALAASVRPGPSTWGLHLAGFLPMPLRVLLGTVLVLGAGTVVAAALRARSLPPNAQPRPARRKRGGTRWAPLLLLASAGLLWMGRERTYFLGDQLVWLDNLSAGRAPLFSEPLAARMLGGFAALLRTLSLPVDASHLAILSVVYGIAAIALSWGIAREIASNPGDRAVALPLIGTVGASQLYFGHIESYPAVSIFLLAFLLLGIRRTKGKDSPLLFSAAIVAAISSHLLLLYLVPSYLVVTFLERRSIGQRLALGVVPLLTAGVAVAMLGMHVEDVFRPFRIIHTGIAAGGSVREARAGGLIPALLDFLNSIALVMPVPAILLAARIASIRSGAPFFSPEMRFLVSAAAPGLLATIFLIFGGTSAQDWDLLAVTLVPLALVGIALATRARPGSGVALARAGLLAVAAGSLASFVLVNAIERAGVQRFQTLMRPSANLRRHERAFGNEKLVKYFNARKDYASMLVHARQAAEAEPTIPRYWSNIGTALYGLGRYEEAARYFEDAASKGMRQDQLFYTLGLCYMNLNRPSLAAARFGTANEISGGNPDYLSSMGFAMLASGDPSGARAAWQEVLARWPHHEETKRAYEQLFGSTAAPAP